MPAHFIEGADHRWLAAIIFRLDRHLQRRHAVFEYTRNPRCIFRIQVHRLDQAFILSDGTRFRLGGRVVDLHLWNEQVPRLCTGTLGRSLGWARRMNECLDISLRELAGHLVQRSDLEDVAVIRANMSFGTAQQSAQLVRIASRYGFESISDLRPRSLGQRIHQFGENILISLMVLARSSAALRRDSLWRDRTEVFLSRQTLDARFKKFNYRGSRPYRQP